jgi:hypothetical protein
MTLEMLCELKRRRVELRYVVQNCAFPEQSRWCFRISRLKSFICFVALNGHAATINAQKVTNKQ